MRNRRIQAIICLWMLSFWMQHFQFPAMALERPLNTTHEPEIQQEKFSKPFDVYLTEDRICKKCTGRYINSETIELKNRKGKAGLYHVDEIIGVDVHPLARRFWLHSFRGVGLPGKIIVPQAFEEEKYLHY